jgi:UDP-N-acetylglucosamine--N-acetylmuramyl-(pentapeptide) pyrophosphoryl-undecaprenol N-acetylglucosamine transferase
VLIAGGGTGGHLMPALAIAQTLRELRPDVEPVLVGAQRGVESHVLPRYPFRHYLLPLEPVHRGAWWRNLRWPLLVWRVLREVKRVIRTEQPAIVIGTGGYASGPVLWRAQRARIPTVLQEQNAIPGIATRWLARRARQIHLGFPEARELLRPGRRTEIYTLGNPIRPPVPGSRDAAHRAFGLDPARRTLLVFGGSQGAHVLNRAVDEALVRGLLGDLNLLWGTGTAHASGFARRERPGRVVVRGFFDPIATAYQAADLIVCRAGAMTIAELCAWAKPSVLVPLARAAADHQTSNARALADAGGAVMLPEADLSAQTLTATLSRLVEEPSRLESMSHAAGSRGRATAARDIVSKILTLIL